MADKMNKKVTISADYFVELYRKAYETDTICKECREDRIQAEYASLLEDYGELKEKLEDANKHYCTSATGNKAGDACVVAKRCQDLEAALKAANETNSAQADQLRDALNEAEKYKKLYSTDHYRMDAAERCIDKVYGNVCFVRAGSTLEEWVKVIQDIVFGYRKEKEKIK